MKSLLFALVLAVQLWCVPTVTAQVQSEDKSPAEGHSNHGSEQMRFGELLIGHAHTRATAPGASVAAGYLSIENTGSVTERLLGARAAFADITELHSMKIDNDVMKMRKIKGGLMIAPGEVAEFTHGGNHIMFKKLKAALVAGETKKLILLFEQAGEVEISLPVTPIR